jgi:hypothetical protein
MQQVYSFHRANDRQSANPGRYAVPWPYASHHLCGGFSGQNRRAKFVARRLRGWDGAHASNSMSAPHAVNRSVIDHGLFPSTKPTVRKGLMTEATRLSCGARFERGRRFAAEYRRSDW